VEIRFYLDASGKPHIHRHGVGEDESRSVVVRPAIGRPTRRWNRPPSRFARGRPLTRRVVVQIEDGTLIQLIGPGGAGKSTTGALLAERLGVTFADLDERFMSGVGHIGEFIESRGYRAYAARNVALYAQVIGELQSPAVLALSSGFMTYPSDIHERYSEYREKIAASPTTFVLLPSLDYETCVAEIVRRQLARTFIGQSAAHEEDVIRKRFWIYSAVPAHKVETMRSPVAVVDEVAHAAALIVVAADRSPTLAAAEPQGRWPDVDQGKRRPPSRCSLR